MPLDTDALMALVKQRAELYRSLDAGGGLALPEPLPPVNRGPAPGQAPVPRHPSVHVRDLLALEGPDLVRSAFQRILWRDPSPAELAHRVDQLRSASVDPSQFLRQLRFSAEGSACGVVVEGMGFYHWLRAPLKIRRIGVAWRVLLDVCWLPRFRAQVHRAVTEQRSRIDRHDIALRGLVGSHLDLDPAPATAALRQRIVTMEARINELERRLLAAEGKPK